MLLQSEVQSKTQQVKQYKKQVDQFRGELDRCHSDMEVYKQHAEQHKHLVSSVVCGYGVVKVIGSWRSLPTGLNLVNYPTTSYN